MGGIYIDVPNWDHRDWAHVAARAKLGPGNISLGFNVPGSEADTANTFPQYPSASRWTTSQAINLGSLARFF